MSENARPLSPHLQVYKPQLTSVLSITHRGTGIFLSLGAVLLVYWLVSISHGPQSYASLHECLSSWLGQLLLIAWTFSLFFHLCNGVRHLFWDAGTGYEIRTAYASGYAVLGASLLLTVAAWSGAWWPGAGA
jgi:succinate dehydrogenase / fumarate reductase cytochrome b subunit